MTLVGSEALIGIYLDANAFIRFVEGEDRGYHVLTGLSVENRAALFTSEVTLAEVLVRPFELGDAELAELYEELLTTTQILTVVPVNRAVLRASVAHRAAHKNKGMDAIHLASALLSRCSVFVSSDKRIRLPSGLRRVDADDLGQFGARS